MPHALVPITLVANEQVKPRLHRLTFRSDEFADYLLTGPDEYFGLVMPKEGQQFNPFPVDGLNIRSAVSSLPEVVRPDLRWYTIRKHDPEQRTIEVEVVTHGDTGPGSRWIRRARPGDTAGMFTCPALWKPPTGSQLLVADASAMPAMRHILAYQSVNAASSLQETDAVAVVTADEEVEEGLTSQWGDKLRSITIVEAEKKRESEAVLSALHSLYELDSAPRSVWVSGEGDLTKAVRKLAIKGWGLHTDDVVWVPFWFHGKARP